MFDGIHAENTDDSSKGFVYLAGGTFDIASQHDGIIASAWLHADDGTYTVSYTHLDVDKRQLEYRKSISI